MILLALMLLLFPLRLIAAWFIAVTIHELGHYAALRLMHIQVFSVCIKASGAVMEIEPITGWRECACAAAGPLAGFSIMAVARWMPCTAIFAFIHSLYNLLPICSLDGGRILRALFKMISGKVREKIFLQTQQTNSTINKSKYLERDK